jgi:hypothetical protein
MQEQNETIIRTSYVRYLKNTLTDIQKQYSITKKATDKISPAVKDRIITSLAYALLAYATSFVFAPIAVIIPLFEYPRKKIREFILQVNQSEYGPKINDATSNILSGFITFIFDTDNKFNETIEELREQPNKDARLNFAQRFIRDRLNQYLESKDVVLPHMDLQRFLTPYILYLNHDDREYVIQQLAKHCSPVGFYEFPDSTPSEIQDQRAYFKKTIQPLNCNKGNIIEYIMRIDTTDRLKHKLVHLLFKIWWWSIPHSDQVYLYFNFNFKKMFANQLKEYPNLIHYLYQNFFKRTELVQMLFIQVNPRCIESD